MRDMIKPAVSLFIICFVTAFCLAFVNNITKEPIVQRMEADAEEKRKQVLSQAESFEKLEGWEAQDESGIIKEVYAAYIGEELAGYVFSATPKGFGGEIAVTVGIDSEYTITGVKIGDNQETPGLGSKTADDKFTKQYSGKDIGNEIKIVKRPASADDEIQAVSGATVSSRAVTSAVQASAELGEKLLENGGGSK
jgi:electron transport complex protein RnfG